MSVSLGDALLYLGTVKDGLQKGLKEGEKETQSWTAKVSKKITDGIWQGVGQGLVKLASGLVFEPLRQGVRSLTDGMVSGNAEFEQYNTQFKVLLGSVDAAKKRMAELNQFAVKTPFEITEIVKADIILQGFGLHAEDAARRFGKSGLEIRTIAGDVASGTSASFEEISGYLGKFSAGATGQAIQRFQELGIVTRRELEAMGLEFSKSGELVSPLDEAMTVLLTRLDEKYGGMMDAQSATLLGMQSNLEDWKTTTSRTLGEPIFNIYKQQLSSLLEWLDSPAVESAIMGLRDLIYVSANGGLAIIKGFAAAGKSFFTALFGDFDTMSTNLQENGGEWGKNIILQFAKGMAAAATAVVRVLNQIAGIISYWLKPGSPPRILPDLDKWGTGAMQAYLDEFGSADVGVLRGIAGRLGNYLQNLVRPEDFNLFSTISGAIGGLMRSQADSDDEGLVGRILGSREVIARAIADIREMGGVGAQTMQMLETALGSLPPVAMQYVQAMLSLAEANERVRQAQEGLTAVTKEYDDQLKPLNDELNALRTAQMDVADDKRIKQLQRALERGALRGEQRKQALAEIRARELAKQIRGIEQEKKTAVEAAQEKLDAALEEQKAAQAAADMQAAMIQAQQESNDLIQQQISLLERLANTVGAIGGELEKLAAGGGLGDALGDLGLGNLDLGENSGLLENLFDEAAIQQMVDDILKEFDPLNQEMALLGENAQLINTRWQALTGSSNPLVEAVKGVAIAFGMVKVGGLVSGLLTTISSFLTATGVAGGFGAKLLALAGPVGLIVAVIAGIAIAVATDFMGIRTSAEQMASIVEYAFFWMLNRASIAATQLVAIVGLKFFEMLNTASVASSQLWTIVKFYFWKTLNDASTAASQLVTIIRVKWDQLVGKTNEMSDGIADALGRAKDFVTGLWDAIKGFWEWLKNKVFKIDIKLPTLPAWAIPGSPIPLHTAWADFADEMNRMVIRPRLDLAEMGGLAGGSVGAPTPAPTAGKQVLIQFTGDFLFNDGSAVEAFVSYLHGLSDVDALTAAPMVYG